MKLDEFRHDLLEATIARLPEGADASEHEFAFVCEAAARLTDAEEFQDLIPIQFVGSGSRGRRLKVDGYEIDETDDSVRLAIADFKGGEQAETITRTKAEGLFGQLQAFVEDSVSGRIFSSADIPELATLISQKHGKSLARYRFYLLTDAVLSDRLKDLPTGLIDGCPVEFHIWDASRLLAVSASELGTEELEIDFTELVDGGLPCLEASQTTDYRGYLCVIPGNALAELYERFGSRLLEGNVRSYLSASGKINKGIQSTIRAEPERFFVYNNGISATATQARIVDTASGLRLQSARYLQIVNGGQTTASLDVARRKDKADLSAIHVQMKLSVVEAEDQDGLDEMIQRIAMYSNKQNKVSDADFFSNHPFHRAIERVSRRIPAPAAGGAQFLTYWFYERARGQYLNEQSKMTPSERKEFQRTRPRAQLLTKTDLAKYENSWRQLPQVVSLGAQKNFANFADYVGKAYGDDGSRFDNDSYFKQVIAKTILFRYIEKMVSQAGWYEGGYRANIVAYTMAKLAQIIEQRAPGRGMDFKTMWSRQAVSTALSRQLEEIAKVVVAVLTMPPVAGMNITEWCKKTECWDRVKTADVPLMAEMQRELLSPDDVSEERKEIKQEGERDAEISAEVHVVQLGPGYWGQFANWCACHSPLYGKEADLVKLASRRNWVPSPKQATLLMSVSKRVEGEGFRRA